MVAHEGEEAFLQECKCEEDVPRQAKHDQNMVLMQGSAGSHTSICLSYPDLNEPSEASWGKF